MQFLNPPFPSGVVFAALKRGQGTAVKLFAEEEALVTTRATQRRREEFLLGRRAAHLAMERLEDPVRGPVLRRTEREPLWPEGLVGSISHSGEFAVAAVAHAGKFAGIGIDLEDLSRALQLDITGYICGPAEAAWVHADAAHTTFRTFLLFSAKESLYKAFYPLVRRYFGFKEAELTFIREGELRAEMKFSFAPRTTCSVFYQSAGGYLLTWVLLPEGACG